MMNHYMRIMKSISRFLNWGCIIMLAFLAVFTLIDVLGRSIFNHPVNGAYELTELGLVLMLALGLGNSEILKAHVRVDLFMAHCSEKTRLRFDMINNFISSGICILMGWRMILHALHLRHVGTTSGLLEIPVFPFVFLLAIGFIVLGCVFFSEFCEGFMKGS